MVPTAVISQQRISWYVFGFVDIVQIKKGADNLAAVAPYRKNPDTRLHVRDMDLSFFSII